MFFIKTNDSTMDTTDEVSYANQIHSIVSNSVRDYLFASDVIGQINCPEGLKDNICKNLFVYSKKGVSISGSNIDKVYSKNKIEIINNGDVILTVKRSKKLGLVKLAVILYILTVIILAQMIIPLKDADEPIVTVNHEASYEQSVNTNDSSSEIVTDTNDNILPPSLPDNTQVPEINDVNDTVGDLDDGNNDIDVTDITQMQNTGTAIEPKQKQIKGNESGTLAASIETTSETENLVQEANNYFRIAEDAYQKYILSLDEEDGIKALIHYKKALEISEYLPDKKESIVEHINTLQKVIN